MGHVTSPTEAGQMVQRVWDNLRVLKGNNLKVDGGDPPKI